MYRLSTTHYSLVIVAKIIEKNCSQSNRSRSKGYQYINTVLYTQCPKVTSDTDDVVNAIFLCNFIFNTLKTSDTKNPVYYEPS